MSRWEKFKNLSRWELWLLCKAFLLLPVTALGLRLMGFKAVRSALSYGLPASVLSIDARAIAQAQKIAKMVQVAVMYRRFGATCLPQSMVLWRFLQRHGIGCDLRLGARTENGNFEAHAWVEVDGVALNETADVGERFRPLEPEANGIRNWECGMRKIKAEVGGQGPEGGDQRAEIRGMKTEDGSQRSEDRGQRSEDRSQKTEVRGQKSEVRGQRSEVRGQRSEVRRQKHENRR